MKNQVYTGTTTSRRFALCPSSVTAGMPVLLGTIPAVALDDYQSNTGGATFLENGTFALTVIGETAASPQVTAAIKPGAKLYASGTLDSTTNVTTALTIDANSSNTLFGRLDPSYSTITSGTIDTAAQVQINVGAA